MDDRSRERARTHWAALDAAMTRPLTGEQIALCRDGVRWGLADIATKYATRLIDTAGDDARSIGIEEVGRELAAALSASWDHARNGPQSPATEAPHS